MRISDWSSDVCSSDLREPCGGLRSDAEDGVDGPGAFEPLDRLAAILRKPREDQRAGDVRPEVDLVVVHHVGGPLRPDRWSIVAEKEVWCRKSSLPRP